MARFTLTAQLRLQAPTNVGPIVASIRNQLQGITANVNIVVSQTGQRSLNIAQKNIRQTAKSAKEAQGAVEAFGGASALAAKRFLAFSLAGGAIISLAGALSKGVSEAISFEREMNKIAQATGSSAQSIKQISTEISRLSSTFGVSSSELAKASLVLAQAGLTAEDTRVSLAALAKSDLAPTFESIADTAEASIAMIQQFSVSATQLESKLGSINSVAAKFAVESSDITTAIRRTGGAFQAAGGSLNELLALFTSVRQTTRESAESIATGFRTIFTRLQRTRTQNFLKSMGIDLQDIEGQFVGPYRAVQQLSLALKNLPGTDPRFAQIIEELGGFRQISKVIPLIKQFDVSQKALNVAMAGTGSLSEDAARAQGTLAVQIAKVREEFLSMVRDFSSSQSFKTMADVALKLASAFIKVAESLRTVMPLMTLLVGLGIGKSIIPFVQGVKQKAVSGYAKGGLVPTLLTPGELVLDPQTTNKVGLKTLNRVNKFARGGIVPGVGNRDTVPRMLPEGSFVVNKKSTEAMGFNRGGRVQKLAKGGETYRSIGQSSFSDQPDKDQFHPDPVGAIFLRSDLGTDSSGLLERGLLTSKTKKGNVQVPFTAVGFSNAFEEKFEKAINNNLIGLSNNLGSMIAGELGATQDNQLSRKSQLSNLPGITGGLFEAALVSLGPPFTEDQATFDFPQGIGSKAKNWVGGSELATIPVDAKRTWNAKNRLDLAKKAANIIDDQSLLNIPPRVNWEKGQPLPKALNQQLGARKLHEKIRWLRDQDYDFDYIPPNTSGPNTPAQFLGRNQGGAIGSYPWTFKPQKSSIALGNVGPTKQRMSSRLQWLQANQSRLSPQELKEFLGLQARMGFVQQSRTSRFSQRFGFAEGGKVERLVGYLDGDVLGNPENEPIVTASIKKLGLKGGVTAYHRYLVGLASQKRQAGTLKKFKGLYGVPGSGKTHLVKAPKPGDNATLRTTKRVPILTPEDIDRVSEVVDTIAYGPKLMDEVKQGGVYSNVDRMFMLSSSTKAEQKLVDANRKLRGQQTAAGISTTAEGRSADQAAVRGAPIDSGAAEAVAYKALGKSRTAVLGMMPGYKLRKKTAAEIPDIEEEVIAILYGALSPSTVGHGSNAKLAKDAGIADKNLFVNISKIGGTAKEGDEHSQRTVIYDQNMRAALAQRTFPNATIVKVGSGEFLGSAPTVFERPTQGGRRQFVKAAPGSIALTGDDKDVKETDKYTKSGYKLIQGARDDISGTGARQAVRENNEAEMKRVFAPEALSLIKQNQAAIQNRTNIMPEIFKRVKLKVGDRVAEIDKELEQYPKAITAKFRLEQPAIVEKMEALRAKKAKFKSMNEKLPPRYLGLLAKLFKDKYGFQGFQDGGLVPGQGNSDTVPIVATPGEFVLNKNAVKGIGSRNLQKFNKGGMVQRFASGGLTGMTGGLGGLAGIGLLTAGVSAFTSTFSGVNSSMDKFIGGVTGLITQFTLLNFATKSTNETVWKFDKKIEASTKKIDENKIKDAALKQDALKQRKIGLAATAASVAPGVTPAESARQLNIAASAKLEKGRLIAERKTLSTERKTEKTNIADIQSKQSVVSNVSMGVGIATALTGAIGNYLETEGRAKVVAGKGGESQFTIGKTASTAASYAGIGMAAGAMFGPLGIAVGAAAGGLLGFYKGLRNAEKEISNIKLMNKFNKELTKASFVLESFAKGSGTFDTTKSVLGNYIASTNKSLMSSSTSDESRQDILAQSKGQVENVNVFLAKAAEKSKSFAEFINIAGVETLDFVASLQKIPIHDLYKQWNATIIAQNKAKASALTMAKVQDEYAIRLKNIINITQAFESVSAGMQAFDNSLNNIVGQLEGNVPVSKVTDDSAILSDPAKFFNPTKFAEVLARDITKNSLLKTAFADPTDPTKTLAPLNEQLTKDVKEAELAIRSIPNVLLGLRDNLTSFDAETAVEKLVNEFDSGSEFVRNAIRQAAVNLIGSEGKESAIVDKLKANFNEVSKEFAAGLQPILDTAAMISKKMSEESNRRAEYINKYIVLSNKELEIRQKGLDIYTQSLELMATATNKPVDLNALQAADNQRQINTLGVDADVMNDPLAIGNRLLSVQNEINARKNMLDKVSLDAQTELNVAINEGENRVLHLGQALDNLADISARSAITMRKIEKERGNINFRTNLGDQMMFATSVQEKRDVKLKTMVGHAAAETGDIETIPLKLRGTLQQLLKETEGMGALNVFGGRTSEQVSEKLRYNFAKDQGATDEDATKYSQMSSNELVNQTKILAEQTDIAKEANRIAGVIAEIKLEAFRKELIDSIVSFKNLFALSMDQKAKTDVISSGDADINKAEKMYKARTGLEGMMSLSGGNEETSKALASQIGLMKEYQKETLDKQQLMELSTRGNALGRERIGIGARGDTFGTSVRKDINDRYKSYATTSGSYTGAMDMKASDVNAIQQTEEARLINFGATDEIIGTFRDAMKAGKDRGGLDIGGGKYDFNKYMMIVSEAVDAAVNKASENTGKSDAEEKLKNLGLLPFANQILYTEGALAKFEENFAQFNLDPRPWNDLNTEIIALVDVIAIKRRELERLNTDIGRREAELNAIKPVDPIPPIARATGGFIHGSGFGDKVRALLEPGEFVLNRNAVSAIGLGPLNAVNDGIARFRDGGRVLNPEDMALASPAFSNPTPQAPVKSSNGMPAYNGPGYEWKGVKYKTLDAMLDAQKTPEAKKKADEEWQKNREQWLKDNERIAKESAASKLENEQAQKRMDFLKNASNIDYIKADLADPELAANHPIQRRFAQAALGMAYGLKVAGHVGDAGLDAGKTTLYGTATGLAYGTELATGSDVAKDVRQRFGLLTEATASDFRGNAGMGTDIFGGTNDAERQQLTGGVGFSKDFTEGQKLQSGLAGTGLDLTLTAAQMGAGFKVPGFSAAGSGGRATRTGQAIVSGAKNSATAIASDFGITGASIRGAANAGKSAAKSVASTTTDIAIEGVEGVSELIGAGISKVKNFASKTKAAYKESAAKKAADDLVMAKYRPQPVASVAATSGEATSLTESAMPTLSKLAKKAISPIRRILKPFDNMRKNASNMVKKFTSDPDAPVFTETPNTPVFTEVPKVYGPKIKNTKKATYEIVDDATGLPKPAPKKTFKNFAEERAYHKQEVARLKQDEASGKFSRQELTKRVRELNDAKDDRHHREMAAWRKANNIKLDESALDDVTSQIALEKQNKAASRAYEDTMTNKSDSLHQQRKAFREQYDQVIADAKSGRLSDGEVDGRLATLRKADEAAFEELDKIWRKQNGFQSGSLVPGHGSGDKVRALLEPGEFVLNRNAVSAIGAGTLSQINKKIGRFQKGGPVKMQEGGMAALGGSYVLDASQMEKAVQNFAVSVDKLATFSDSMNGLSIQLQATHTVEVIINGAQVLQGLNDSMQNLIVTETNKAINSMLDKRFSLPPMD